MDQPVFPQQFVREACPQVAEARDWRRRFNLEPDPEDDAAYAECAFHRAGSGLECESCSLRMARPYLGHKKDKRWLPEIEKYYEDMKLWEDEQEKQRIENERISVNMGAGI